MTGAEQAGPPPGRPLEVTVLVVVAAFQGLVLIGIGWLLVVLVSDPEVVNAVGGAEIAAVVGWVLLGLGVVRLLLGLMLLQGRELVRSIMGGLAVAQIAFAVYALLALRAVAVARVLGVALAVGELWLLYGSARSRRFFVR